MLWFWGGLGFFGFGIGGFVIRFLFVCLILDLGGLFWGLVF